MVLPFFMLPSAPLYPGEAVTTFGVDVEEYFRKMMLQYPFIVGSSRSAKLDHWWSLIDELVLQGTVFRNRRYANASSSLATIRIGRDILAMDSLKLFQDDEPTYCMDNDGEAEEVFWEDRDSLPARIILLALVSISLLLRLIPVFTSAFHESKFGHLGRYSCS